MTSTEALAQRAVDILARLVAFGPVSEFVPGSLLQLRPTDYTLLGSVADDLVIDMS